MDHDRRQADPSPRSPTGPLAEPDAYIELTLGEALHARIWVNGRASEAIGQILAFADPGRTAPGPRRTARLEPQLLPLIEAGLLSAGQELTWHRPRLHRTQTITVTVEGALQVPDGSVWPSPYQAAHRIAGSPADGWACFTTADGRSLQELRASLEDRQREPNPPTLAIREGSAPL